MSMRKGLDSALGVWSRRKWLALALFGLTLSAALSFSAALPSVYESRASVLVERMPSSEGPDEVESRLKTIRHEILSRARLVDLIYRFDLYPRLRKETALEAVVEKLRRDIRIDESGTDSPSGRGGTIAFSVSYRGSDPRKVALVANTLTSSYIAEDARLRERQASGAARLLGIQLEEVKKRLAAQETKIADFKRSYGGELPQTADSDLTALARLNAQVRQIGETRAALLRQTAEPLAGPAATDPDGGRARLERLNGELAELRAKFSDKYPDVVRKKAEIAALAPPKPGRPVSDPAAAAATIDRTPRLLQVDRELRALQAEEARLQRRMERAPWREQEFQALSRDYATTKEFYETLLKRYEEARLEEGHEDQPEGQRLRLLDSAIAATEPTAPNHFRLALFGLIASLGMAVASVAAAERLDTSFHSVDQLRESTRVPILVCIPRMAIETDADRGRRRLRAALLAAGVVLGMAATVKVSQTLAHGNEGVVALLSRGRS